MPTETVLEGARSCNGHNGHVTVDTWVGNGYVTGDNTESFILLIFLPCLGHIGALIFEGFTILSPTPKNLSWRRPELRDVSGGRNGSVTAGRPLAAPRAAC